jgi:glycosyltransferase involved in cell wall biosynthesis
LSRELVRRGHVVYHAYFADNASTPKSAEADGDGIPNLTIDGIHIGIPFDKHGIFTRRDADIEYGKAVALRVRQFLPDVVISGNMPLDGQRILLEETKRIGARFVFWLQDIYYTAIRFVLKRKLRVLAEIAALYYKQVEKRLLEKSDAIICIAPAFADELAKWKIDSAKVSVIPNWAPVNEIVPTSKDNAWASQFGVQDRLRFMYSGTLGMKHRPDLLLELAKRIEKRADMQLVVIAGGAGADWLAEKAHEVDRDVMRILPFQPYERISESLGTADVLITLLDSEASGFAVPSKTLAYLCAGRPQIIAAPKENEAARVVVDADAGIVVSPDHLTEFSESAMNLMDDSEARMRFGRNAREYAERRFAIIGVADSFLEVLKFASRPVRYPPSGH